MKKILIFSLLVLTAPAFLHSAEGTNKMQSHVKKPVPSLSGDTRTAGLRQPDQRTLEILKKIAAQQHSMERKRASTKQFSGEKSAVHQRDVPKPRRARFLGKETPFLEAPPSILLARTRAITQAARTTGPVSATNALIDGKVSDTVYVGDNGHLTFSFAPGYVSAVINFYYDQDNDGQLSEKDLLLSSNILLMDNDERDADVSPGSYSLPLNSSLFSVTELVGSYVVSVDNFQSVSTVQLVIRQRPEPGVVHITTAPALPNLVVEAATPTTLRILFTDSTGAVDLAVDRSVTPQIQINVYDAFGYASDYIPPPYRMVQLASDTTVQVFSFTKGASRIQGVCLDDAAKPVVNATIYAESSSYSVRARTDSSGTFSFALQAGEWYVYVQPPTASYMAPNVSLNVLVDSLATTNLNLRLRRANTSISGSVRYLSAGVGGIMIEAYTDTVTNSVLTDADGYFSVPVLGPPSGTVYYTLQPLLNNYSYYVAAPGQATVPPGTQSLLFTLLKVSGGMQGTVRDSLTGKPLANVSISFSGPTYTSCTTDSAGSYHIPLRDGQYSVYASAPRHESFYLWGLNVSGSYLTLDIALYPSGAISGMVRDQKGSPISSAEVDAFDSSHIFYGAAYSDPAGKYLIDYLPAGKYITSASANGYMMEYYPNTSDPGKAVPVSVQLGIETPNIDFSLSTGGSIAGTVLNKAGVAVPFASVMVYDTAYTYRASAVTNDSGRYLTSGLTSGSYLVYVSAQDYASIWYDNSLTFLTATRVHVIVDQVTPDINFTMFRAGSISGHVLDNLKRPLMGAWISLYDTLLQGYSFATTDDSGRYVMTGLPPGTFKAYAWMNNAYQWYDHKLSSESANPIRLSPEENRAGIDFTLYVAGIYGMVVDRESGSGIPYAKITAAADNGTTTECSTDDSGSYSLAPPTGEYTLRISCEFGNYACRYYYTSGGPVLLESDAEKVPVDVYLPAVRIDFRIPEVQNDIGCTLSNFDVTLTNHGVLSNYGDVSKPSGRWPTDKSKDYLAQASPMVGGLLISVPWVYGDMYGSPEGVWHTAMGFLQSQANPQITRSDIYSTEYFQAGYGLGILMRQELAAWPGQDFILCRQTIFYDANSPSTVPEFSGIYTGLFADFDITSSGLNDLAALDTTNRLVYIYDGTKHDSTYMGICVLGTAPVHLGWWQSSFDTAFHDVAAKYAALGTEPTSEATSQMGDYRLMASTGPFTLHHGDSLSATLALVAGRGLSGVIASAQAARAAYHTLVVKDAARDIPEAFNLAQNYPNPFNPSTTVTFDLPRQAHAVLKVYNVLGQEVSTLVDEVRSAGHYSVRWLAGSAASGVYFYTLRAASFVQTRKMLLLR